VVIGYEDSSQLDVEPAKYFVLVTKREKRACQSCEDLGVGRPLLFICQLLRGTSTLPRLAPQKPTPSDSGTGLFSDYRPFTSNTDGRKKNPSGMVPQFGPKRIPGEDQATR
jgi:hypothetical protein